MDHVLVNLTIRTPNVALTFTISEGRHKGL